MNFVDRLACAWAVILVGLILFLQQPGGLEHSLDWGNLWGGWGKLFLILVGVPWFILRIVAGIFTAAVRRY